MPTGEIIASTPQMERSIFLHSTLIPPAAPFLPDAFADPDGAADVADIDGVDDVVGGGTGDPNDFLSLSNSKHFVGMAKEVDTIVYSASTSSWNVPIPTPKSASAPTPSST